MEGRHKILFDIINLKQSISVLDKCDYFFNIFFFICFRFSQVVYTLYTILSNFLLFSISALNLVNLR